MPDTPFDAVEEGGRFRWRLRGVHGVVLEMSDATFDTKEEALRAAQAFAESAGKGAGTKAAEPDWSKGLLAAAGGLVVGVLAATGITGDLLVRMVRNEPSRVGGPLIVLLALGLIVGACTAWQNSTSWLRMVIVAATIVAGGSLGALAFWGAEVQNDREIPSVALELTDGDRGLSLHVTASASSLPSDDVLLVQVLELPDPTDTLEELKLACKTPGNLTLVGYGHVRRFLGWTEVGPNAKGEATADLTIPVGDSTARAGADVHYCALAYLTPREKRDFEGTDNQSKDLVDSRLWAWAEVQIRHPPTTTTAPIASPQP